MLKQGQDPRKVLSTHRERGPKRLVFTYEDIARTAGMTEGALRVAISRGQIDPSSLESLMEFIAVRRGLVQENRRPLKTLVQEARTALEED